MKVKDLNIDGVKVRMCSNSSSKNCSRGSSSSSSGGSTQYK